MVLGQRGLMQVGPKWLWWQHPLRHSVAMGDPGQQKELHHPDVR